MRFQKEKLDLLGIKSVQCVRCGYKGLYWWRIRADSTVKEKEMLEFCRDSLFKAKEYTLELLDGVWNYKIKLI